MSIDYTWLRSIIQTVKILKKDIVILFTAIEKGISQGTLYGTYMYIDQKEKKKKKICEKKKFCSLWHIFSTIRTSS